MDLLGRVECSGALADESVMTKLTSQTVGVRC